MNCKLPPTNYADMYALFDAPIAELDCGQYCAPFNFRGKNGPSRGPFCCDTYHAVPTVYQDEWEYLQA
ncbi:MAG TPA: hypothetical protein VLM80_02460, partial [Anaerolineales bacterium]|nr:hypothetical protein [Anaerolineales bacterium]